MAQTERPATALLALAFLAPILQAQEAKLEGTWKADLSASQALVLDIRGTSIQLQLDANGNVSQMWAGKLSFPQDYPDRHFDWVELKAGDHLLPDNKCLYRLLGDTLLVIGGGPEVRPTRFDSGPGTGSRTLVFTKLKR